MGQRPLDGQERAAGYSMGRNVPLDKSLPTGGGGT